MQHKPRQFQITVVWVLTHGSFQLLASVDMHDPPLAYHNLVQIVDRQVERNVSFKLLTCCLIRKCLNDVILTCCDVMESNSTNRVCNGKKDKVVFFDIVLPPEGSAGAAEWSGQYWSPSINSLEGKRGQALKAANLPDLCTYISVRQWMNSIQNRATMCLNN